MTTSGMHRRPFKGLYLVYLETLRIEAFFSMNLAILLEPPVTQHEPEMLFARHHRGSQRSSLAAPRRW